MISGECHCGRVGFEIAQPPDFLVDCNCSICRRLGALWGHINKKNFTRTGTGKTIEYIQGDNTLATQSCLHCGCTTHWENISGKSRMAVNFRMCDPDVVSRFEIRKFDGADTWAFIDK
ncbi:MAG TPA: hypothetical protein VJ984_15340 [Xanthomonadales bacterium]|nr:hypothetical protein [Xanthomonadales bacterium]